MIRRKVQKGTGTGNKIGFPTLNFNVGDFGRHHAVGIYYAEVRIGDKTYKGALFFGHRMGGREKVLEVYVVGFNKMIYGRIVYFRVIKKIRNPKMFKGLEELRKQITDDLKQV